MGQEKVELMYKIPLTGKYNKGVNECLKCGYRSEVLVEDIIGFADSDSGLMAIVECPECFDKWFFHGKGIYECFETYIRFFNHKHFKK